MLMGVVWCVFLAASVLGAVLGGSPGELTPAALEGAGEAVKLCISLAGPLCLWSGAAQVMKKAGMMKKLGRLLRPVFGKLFPAASADEEALSCLTANTAANLLGLGSAATPMGIRAVQRMQALSGSRSATDEMCLLIVINTASIQLLPTTVASVRASLGAAAPFDILPAVWLTSLCSVGAGILAAKGLGKVWHG